MLSIVVTDAEHIKFTVAWRCAIGYSTDINALINTRTALKPDIEVAAKQIYKDYPEILKALGL